MGPSKRSKAAPPAPLSSGASFGLILPILSPIAIYLIYRYVFNLFNLYDWECSFVKLMCFGVLFFLIFPLRNAGAHPLEDGWQAFHLILFLSLLVYTLAAFLSDYLPAFTLPPQVDIGSTTQYSSRLFFLEHKNPYSSSLINIRPELPAHFCGFHYGPFMLFGYFLSVPFPKAGLKISNLLYAAAILILLSSILYRQGGTTLDRLAGIVFFLVLSLLPERLWYELFVQGATDIFPVFLLAACLFCIHKNFWSLAGLFAGLSFSAKFSPAAFLVLIFLRRDIKRNFFLMFLAGLLPLFAFMAWDFSGLLNNVFILRVFALGYDSTSLYSITPKPLHFLFPLVQIATIVALLIRYFQIPVSVNSVVLPFMLLTIVMSVTFKEVHGNHLLWFIPFIPFILAQARLSFFEKLKPVLRSPIRPNA